MGDGEAVGVWLTVPILPGRNEGVAALIGRVFLLAFCVVFARHSYKIQWVAIVVVKMMQVSICVNQSCTRILAATKAIS